MLYFTAPTHCSFDTTVNCLKKLGNYCSREADSGCSEFGGWLTCAPRKRKNKGSIDGETKQKSDKMKLLKSDTYYKRYRVDPLEGTFKHYKNTTQYMQLYRETTTLCYKQRTLQELTAMYSAALDTNSERGHISLPGYSYTTLALESLGKWELRTSASHQDTLTTQHPLNNIATRSESGIPLMLLPTAPSIPTRLSQQNIVSSPIAQASFMCNAYMNRNIVCPVHRVIHRRSCLISSNGRSGGNMVTTASDPGHVEEHIKVTLPGIPKRRYNTAQVKRLKALRKFRPLLEIDSSSKVVAPPNSKGTSPTNSAYYLHDEEEDDSVDTRINNLLSTNNHSSPSDRISKALQQQKRVVPSMQLPVTALLQYSPANTETPVRHAKIKKPVSLKPRQSNKKQDKPKLSDAKQSNYEEEYERFFSDVLESKGKNTQRKHFQNMSK